MFDQLKHVQPGDYVSAKQWNLLVDLLKARERDTGPDRIRTPTGHHIMPTTAGSGTAAFQLVIIRQIADPADLEVKIEFAREGRNFHDIDNDDDYGRYVGEHEYMRTAPGAAPPFPPCTDYWRDAGLWCHTTGIGWQGVVCPAVDDPSDPYYPDTHVESTHIFLAFKPGSKWIVLPAFRHWTAKVDTSARHPDCTVEG